MIEAEQEYFDRVWYGRHLDLMVQMAGGQAEASDDIVQAAMDAAERLKSRYGPNELGAAMDDFEWGVWSGKLSALRWILGDEWDNLDT